MTNNFENENNDDFVEPEIAAEGEGKKHGIAGNVAEAWRTNPLFKFGVLVAAVFAVTVAAVNFIGGSSNNDANLAHLGKAPTSKEAPGGASSPYFRQQTEMANDNRANQALANGGSAMPTPIGQNADVGGFGGVEKKDDPLNELRIETENLKKQMAQQQVQQQQMQQRQQPPEQFDNSLAEAMQRQMQQLLESWKPSGIKNVMVAKAEDLKSGEDKASLGSKDQSNVSSNSQRKKVVNAGTVSYAQLLTEANSDVPGPILAQIVSGPLTGARAVGAFQVSMGYEKYLVLHFTIADKKGKDYSIDAYALDPDTTLGGMATEVDERYFARVILPAAAGFVQGLGQALGQGGSSIVMNGTTTITTQAHEGFRQGMYNGIGQGAQTVGQFLQEQANLTKPLVRVASGTAMGLFFVAPVYESNDGTPQQNATNGGNGANGNNGNTNANYPNGNPYGYAGGYPNGNPNYPGATVTGYGGGSQSSVPYPNYALPGAGYNRNPGGVGVIPTSGMATTPYQGWGQ